MNSPNQKRELSKLRILQFLAQPEMQEFGAVGGRIRGRAFAEPLVDHERLLDVMQTDGLIERRSDTTHKTAKPYFITELGRNYLEAARNRSLFPELAQQQGWADRAIGSDLQRDVAVFLRELPEFQGKDEERMRDVANRIFEIIKIKNVKI